MFCRVRRALIRISVAIVATGAAVKPIRAQDETPDTPLRARATTLLSTYSSAHTKDERIAMRERLVAMADSLEATSDEALASSCLERAGTLSYQLADYDSMNDLCTRGLVLARRSGDRKRLAALLNLQAIHRSITGDNAEAIRLQTDLVSLRRELGDKRGEGIGWHNLAYSYFALFRYPEGIDAIRRALDLHREMGNTYGLAASMSALANALFDVGQRADALAMADSAVVRARRIGDPSLLGSALQGRGRQLHDAGRTAESLGDYREAHDALTTAGGSLLAAVNDVNWANTLLSLDRCDDARSVIDGAIRVLAAIGTADVQVWGECVDAGIRARCGPAEDARDALTRTVAHLESIRDSLPDVVSRADALRMAGDAYTNLAVLDVEAGQPDHAWATIESGTARSLRDELGNDVATLTDLQRVLAELDAAALQFGIGTSERNIACLVTATDVTAVVLSINPGFRMDVEAALRLLSSGASDSDCRVVLDRVARTLLTPLVANLPDVPRLLVFAGDMSGLPFEVLPLMDGSGRYVGDRFAVTYAPSATAFLRLQGRALSEGSVFVVADPDLGYANEDLALVMRATRMSLSPLPEARAEGRAVGRSGTVLLGGEATRSAFMDYATHAGVIHVAAHAVVDGTHPDHSGILLAGEAGGSMLDVDDIMGLPIHADLVSLSGCETAGGYPAMGEGAFGLTRAFLLAGARSVVASCWRVEDAAARRFMELFYDRLRSGAARDIALSDVRRHMTSEGYALRDRSAFVLVGATGKPIASLSRPRRAPQRFLAGAGILVVAVTLVLAWRRRAGAPV